MRNQCGETLNIERGDSAFIGRDSYSHIYAVIGLTRTAAIDYSAKGIRINAVCPGVIRTPMAEELILSLIHI